jgi:hypothetical protein
MASKHIGSILGDPRRPVQALNQPHRPLSPAVWPPDAPWGPVPAWQLSHWREQDSISHQPGAGRQQTTALGPLGARSVVQTWIFVACESG